MTLSVMQLIIIAAAMGVVGVSGGALVERGLDGLEKKRRTWVTAGIVLLLAVASCASLAVDLGWL